MSPYYHIVQFFFLVHDHRIRCNRCIQFIHSNPLLESTQRIEQRLVAKRLSHWVRIVNESTSFVNDRLSIPRKVSSELTTFHLGDNMSYRQYMMKWTDVDAQSSTFLQSTRLSYVSRARNWWEEQRPRVYALCLYPYMLRELESVRLSVYCLLSSLCTSLCSLMLNEWHF